MHLRESQFLNRVFQGIYGPRKGGARIIVDAQNAATGVGKTSLAVSLAMFLSRIFDYTIKPADLTLSGSEYLSRWKEHPDKEQPSVLILDELAGAGAGDSRRAMSNQNVELGSSWQLMRKKRIVSITTLPHWKDADSRMRRAADYRLNCLEQKIGYFRPYSVGASFDRGNTQTRRLDRGSNIKFPNLADADNELYDYLAERKDDLLESDTFDADELFSSDDDEPKERNFRNVATKEERIELAQTLREKGLSQDDIAGIVGRDQSWVSRNTTEPSHNRGGSNRKEAEG